MAALKPTLFISVPRLYNKFFALMSSKNPKPEKGAFAAMFGGCVRMMVTASAPLSTEVKDFFSQAIGVPMCEAYGMTECSGAETVTHIDETDRSHIGGVTVNLELKLVDLPDMNYLSTDKDKDGNLCPRGEICARGYGVIPGYYKMDKKTKEAIDEDGWLHSGDVA